MKLRHYIKVGIIVAIFAALFNPFSLRIFYEYMDDYFVEKDFRDMYNDDPVITSDGEKIDESEIKDLKGSELTGENYGFDITYYPYFSMLNENEKRLYKQIYANINETMDTFLPICDVSIDEVKNTFEAMYNDHPELFWVNTSYSYKYTQTNQVVQVILSYNETAKDLDKSKEIFFNEVNRIVNEANKYKTNYEKEKYVHDYIVKNIKYDKSAPMNQSAYSALINKKTICAGYSRAFQFIMIQLKIPTYYVVGVSSVNHAWNMIKLDDGYYNVDLTWDNSDIKSYKYFNKTDNDFSISHKRTGLSLKLPKCAGTKYRNVSTNKITNNASNSNSEVNDSNSIKVIISNVNSNENSDIAPDSNNEEVSNSNVNSDSNVVVSNDNSHHTRPPKSNKVSDENSNSNSNEEPVIPENKEEGEQENGTE